MTKTKLLTYNYKNATLKRAAVRKAIIEVNAEYAAAEKEDANGKQTVARIVKPMPESKYIGLDEKIEEAERIFRSLNNPELLLKK